MKKEAKIRLVLITIVLLISIILVFASVTNLSNGKVQEETKQIISESIDNTSKKTLFYLKKMRCPFP